MNSINLKNGKSPKVSIGMPVYNGANFIEEALDSLLSQTFRDFELIISDNGSSDKTEEICQNYASRDSRIKYHRHNINRGAAWNFNHLVDLALGKYFMWAAHDDLWLPTRLEKCVKVLNEQPHFIGCYTGTKVMNESGREVIAKLPLNPKLASLKTHLRFGASWRYSPFVIAFSLIRLNILKRTRLIGSFSSSDRILVSELVLLGPFYGIKDYLFLYRQHDHQSTGVNYPTRHTRAAWFDPKKKGSLTFPIWRLLLEHIIAISRTPVYFVSWQERSFCYVLIIRWITRMRWGLAYNLILSQPR